MHGLFLNPSAANALLSYLYGKRTVLYLNYQSGDDPYETLAILFEQHMDMAAIIALLKEKWELRVWLFP